ncbi:MAG: hypothetical protein VKN60_08505 [Cyanobacteriota bacterium]|nr:hypothetical protein [Cyanobacteriota bacterium]
MSSSPGPYQSRLFNFLNRQSLRLRDRLGETFRHLQSAAQLGAQALLYPLYWLLHPHRWTGPLLTPGYSEPQLPPQTGPSLSDEPLRQVLEQIRPWFNEENSPELETRSRISPAPFQPPSKPLDALELRSRENTPLDFTQGKTLPSTPLRKRPSLTPPRPVVIPGAVLARLEQQFFPPALTPAAGLWPFRRRSLPADLVICGVASRLSDRQLILTTDDNQTLDLLSSEQSQALAQSIRLGLADFYYQRRLAWALQQQTWGAISLVNPGTDELTPPLRWLWRGLHWWERGPLTLPPTFPKPEAPILAPLTDLAQTLRRRLPNLTQPALVHLPQSLPSLPALGEIMGAQGLVLERVTSALAPVKTALTEKLSPPLDGSDPFQIQVLIQAAIAYFFGSGTTPALGASSPALSESEPDSLWLSWQDLVSPSSLPLTPGESAPVLPPSQTLAPAVPRSRKRAPVSPGAVVISNPDSASPAPAVHPRLSDPIPDFWLEPGALPSASTLASSNPQDLETAFDWIEIAAQPIGYHKHPLELILEALDRLVLALEDGLRWLWRRVSPLFSPRSKKLS